MLIEGLSGLAPFFASTPRIYIMQKYIITVFIAAILAACSGQDNAHTSNAVTQSGTSAQQVTENQSLQTSDIDTASEPDSQPDANNTKSRKKLSAAAEKAIREGVVEIKDPAVEACTIAKIEALRKEIGEEPLINYETINEAAVECGFNIP